jgi:hypothetical protein
MDVCEFVVGDRSVYQVRRMSNKIWPVSGSLEESKSNALCTIRVQSAGNGVAAACHRSISINAHSRQQPPMGHSDWPGRRPGVDYNESVGFQVLHLSSELVSRNVTYKQM